MLLILYLSILFVSSLAQITTFDSCPNVTPMTNFDINQIAGVWYEIQRYASINENDHKCSYLNYTIISNSQIQVNAFAIASSSGATILWEGSAVSVGNATVADFNMEYPKYSDFRNAEIVILDTDYKTYNIVWMCQMVNYTSLIFAWVYAREKYIDKPIREHIYDVLRQNNVPTTPLTNVEHNNCPQ